MTFRNSKKITFKVDGKPPQKSQWGEDYVANLIIKLRKAAFEARTSAQEDIFDSPVKLKLQVYAPNIDDRYYRQLGDEDEKRYVGDLDSLVAGICDYLSPAPLQPGQNNFSPSPLFEQFPEIGPTRPIIIKDDSQIQSIVAEKILSEKPYYVVEIEPV